MEAIAVLVAAGRGERMRAERPKAFLMLAGESMLRRAARAFEQAASVDALIVVVPGGEEERARIMLRDVVKPHSIVPGGARRQDSVRAGLRQAPREFSGVVLVHDAARPLVDSSLVESVVAATRAHGAALPILPIVDTVKRVRGGRVLETLDREELAGAQTPQGFLYPLLIRAYDSAEIDGLTVTDESVVVERLGMPVHVVAGSALNRKITTPDDLRWAEQCIKERTD
ncbi:MAG: 2-C-methyl-D-erythritol 4-phosphate cytidylyltransferase [Vicinamibacteria bacterium]|nr:2-C-methyl-D-erythritol 4-phosphate cytidylyltransferase [Vicinamibacteria bacterium]